MTIFFLIGPRGCGKTTTADVLEKTFGLPVRDVDASLCASSGKTVAEIVEEGGWPAFRALEKASLAESVTRMRSSGPGPGIIATGGGIVLDPENRMRLRAEGIVIYLAAPPEILAARLEASRLSDASRPALTPLPFAEEIAAVMREREPLYRETAHHVVDATLPPADLARYLHDRIILPLAGEEER